MNFNEYNNTFGHLTGSNGKSPTDSTGTVKTPTSVTGANSTNELDLGQYYKICENIAEIKADLKAHKEDKRHDWNSILKAGTVLGVVAIIITCIGLLYTFWSKNYQLQKTINTDIQTIKNTIGISE